MKQLLLILIATATISTVNGQILKRIADRAKNKVEQKAGDKVDKSIDDATDGKKKDNNKKNPSDNGSSSDNSSNPGTSDEAANSSGGSEESGSATTSAPSTLKTYSKYDFIPGETVIAYEDFSNAEIGDFPTRWNTNATAEVVTVSGKEGKWLKVSKKGVFHPEFVTSLPENFTLEFDLGVNDKWNSWPLAINIAKLKNPEDFTKYGHYVQWDGEHAIHLEFKPSVIASGSDAFSELQSSKDGKYQVNNNVHFANWDNTKTKFAHISIWRQKQRIRVYVNGEKLWDIPRAFDPTAQYNAITVGCQGAYYDPDFYLFNNLRLAVGAPDTRNKLITEGKFVTRGILFDVNKDVVKAESYGTLKDIANVLKENSGVKVKIVGHTDSDGDDSQNMELSKKRAEAVKAALNKEFGIDESRMETDGKGESQPADKNDSELGKANNRRVEFIKL